MDRFKGMVPYLLACAVSFYLLPLMGGSTGGFMLILLIIVPLTCFLASLLYGMNNGWNWHFSIIVGLLFIPTIFIYYNSSAWVYIVGYGMISSTGHFLGDRFKSKDHSVSQKR